MHEGHVWAGAIQPVQQRTHFRCQIPVDGDYRMDIGALRRAIALNRFAVP